MNSDLLYKVIQRAMVKMPEYTDKLREIAINEVILQKSINSYLETNIELERRLHRNKVELADLRRRRADNHAELEAIVKRTKRNE